MTKAEYAAALRDMSCMASGMRPVALHHILGGSAFEKLGSRGRRKHSDWLQIPLHYDYHQGHNGIHTIGAKTWEIRFGYQTDMIDKLCQHFGLDLWALAADDKPRRHRKKSEKIIPHSGTL